jgi:hypothetical protein
MVRELAFVVLARDIEEHGLKQGDVGTVVHCYSDTSAFEVEFVSAGCKTIAVLTLNSADFRPMQGREILHLRGLASG